MADRSSRRTGGSPAAGAARGAKTGGAKTGGAKTGKEDYVCTTREVCITVRPNFLADQSEPEDGHFVWAYRVRIENQGRVPVQLLRRTWRITDGHGRIQHVHGAGVVGQQPILEPGESFEYTSGTPLDTPSGFMMGAYHMIVPSSGEMFDVTIPPFSLDSPHQRGQVH